MTIVEKARQTENIINILVEKGEFKTVPNPKRVVAVLEPKCNLNCIHCFWDNNRNYGPKNKSWKKHINQIVKWGADLLYGGRILSPSAACFIEKYCAASGKKIGIVDNGYTILKHPKLYKHYEYINISVDGTRKDHDMQRNQIGSFDVAWNAIKILQTKGIEVIISSAISPFNLKNWAKFENILIKQGIPLSCTPVLGVEENRARKMPLLDKKGLLYMFRETVENGMGKLLHLYSPKHIRILLPKLEKFHWKIDKDGTSLSTTVATKGNQSEIKIIYYPLSAQTLAERNLLCNGQFYIECDIENVDFSSPTSNDRVLSIANRYAKIERPLVERLLKIKRSVFINHKNKQ